MSTKISPNKNTNRPSSINEADENTSVAYSISSVYHQIESLLNDIDYTTINDDEHNYVKHDDHFISEFFSNSTIEHVTHPINHNLSSMQEIPSHYSSEPNFLHSFRSSSDLFSNSSNSDYYRKSDSS